MERLREALTEHFGIAQMKTVPVTEDLFKDAEEGATGGLGSHEDRIEMLLCVEREFGLEMLDEAIVEGEVTLAYLERIIHAHLGKAGA